MKEKICTLFESTKAEAVLLRNSRTAHDNNFYYFSKLPFGNYCNSFLILRPGRKPLLLTTSLENSNISHVSVKKFSSQKHLEKLLSGEFRGIKKIGLNFDSCSKNSFSAIGKILKHKKFIDISKQLSKLRETKTAEEIACIKKAAKISEKAVSKLPGFFRKGMSEKQLAIKLDFLLREQGDNDLAFHTIVASGKNSSVPHHSTSDFKIKKGILLVDFGAKYKNYCSDLTRVFCVGRASQKQKELYSGVFEAKELAQEMCVPGIECRKVFERTNSFLRKRTGFSLQHAIGHGLGLQVHDFPYGFGLKSTDVLREKMVLTIEPAVYAKQFGIRIEDDILISRKGFEQLSRAPKELFEL